jgi:hypothetical protein
MARAACALLGALLASASLGCGSGAGPARTAGDAGPGGGHDTAVEPLTAEDARLGSDGARPEATDAPSVVAPPDAPGTAAPDVGSGACSSLFCEDFEGGQIDPGKWAVQTSGGHTAMIQQNKAAHGKYAAQFHAPPGATGYSFIINKNAPAQLRVHHFGRAYVFVAPKMPAGHTGLMFAGSSGFPRWKYLEVAAIRGGWQLTYVQLAGAPEGETPFHVGCPGNSRCVPTITMTMGAWTCIEWEFNDQPDQIALTADGKPVATDSPILYNNQMSGLVGGFTDFGFGFYDWHPDNFAFDVYYDDIALDIRPIGCL